MQTILLVIHLLLAITLVIVVLLQRSEGGGLGIGGGGGGGGGPGGMMSGRAAANILTRATAVLAALFIGTSLVLAMMGGTNTPRSVVDEAVSAPELMPESAAQPPEVEEPAVPLSE